MSVGTVRPLSEALELPHDGGGYGGRTCPRCRARFKVRASPRDERVVAVGIAARAHAIEAGTSVHVVRHCPYCGEREDAEAFWTPELLAWVEAQARRLSEAVRFGWLCGPHERLAGRSRPTYVPVPPDARPPAPPREACEPLVAVPLPCCGEEELVSPQWSGPARCHYCGYVHTRDLVRDFGLELAQLREWGARR